MGQYRRDGVTPYINHVEAVVSRLEDDFDRCVAWLHDVLEDTEETPEGLCEHGIDQGVIEVVKKLTHGPGDYFDYVRKIAKDPAAKRVKIADILSNLSDKPTNKQIVKYSKALLILLDKLP